MIDLDIYKINEARRLCGTLGNTRTESGFCRRLASIYHKNLSLANLLIYKVKRAGKAELIYSQHSDPNYPKTAYANHLKPFVSRNCGELFELKASGHHKLIYLLDDALRSGAADRQTRERAAVVLCELTANHLARRDRGVATDADARELAAAWPMR